MIIFLKDFLLLIIALLITTFITVFSESEKPKYYIMTSTGYSNHPACIADKWRDGKTALNTPVKKGVVAINVDMINGKWQVRSPLKLGQKIYIEGMGRFSVEDTGCFTERNFHFDYWNVDIYFDTLKEAEKWGIKKVKVFVIE